MYYQSVDTYRWLILYELAVSIFEATSKLEFVRLDLYGR